jgi:hypothetical protein
LGIASSVLGITGAAMVLSNYFALITVLTPLLAIFLGLLGSFKRPRRYAAIGLTLGAWTTLFLLPAILMTGTRLPIF